MSVYDDRRQPIVRLLWDPMSDVNGGDEIVENYQILLPTHWCKDIPDAWRMDVELGLVNNEEDNNEEESETSDDENESKEDSELEFESDDECESDNDADSD